LKHELDQTSRAWDKRVSQHMEPYAILSPRYGLQIRQIIRDYGVNPRSILEVAAFSAKDSRYLAEQFPHCQLYALDFSQGVVEWIKAANDRSGLKNIQVVRANAFQLPFENKSLDISFAADFYIYFQRGEILRIFNEQMRVTRGLVVVFAQNKYNLYRLLYWCKAKIGRDPWYEIGSYSLKDMKKMFAGQQILAGGGFDSWFLNLVNTVGKGFLDKPLCPKLIRDKFNQMELLKKPWLAQINYIIIKAG
jgi:hypothetical protein